MEALFFLLVFVVVLVPLFIITSKSGQSKKSSEPAKNAHLIRYDNETRDIWGKTDSAGEAEQYVTQELLRLGENYFIFQNVILPSAYSKMPYTEVDHIIVCKFGIFCIETKSHVGNIYGNKDADKWKQYLFGGKVYPIHNPLKQSYPHKEALKKFLGSNLRSSIHYYVVFPNAHTVKVNSELVTRYVDEIVDRIANHQTIMYDNHDLERILKSLAHYDQKHILVEDSHITGVQNYLNNKE